MSLAVQSAIDATKPLHNASPAIDTDAPDGECGWALNVGLASAVLIG
jgi:hypothetical protein